MSVHASGRAELRVELLAKTENLEALVYAAMRQCYHKGFVGDMWPRLLRGEISLEEQHRMIAKILDSGHESPLEHVSFTFAIAGVSRALTHQLVRHRIASYSQQSQRYTDSAGLEFVIPPQIAANPGARERFLRAMSDAAQAYEEIQNHLAIAGASSSRINEDARFVLPNAMETKIVVTMNLRSLLHFFGERCCNRAQWEIRAMAHQMLQICKGISSILFGSAGAKCLPHQICPESKEMTCGRYPTMTALKESLEVPGWKAGG